MCKTVIEKLGANKTEKAIQWAGKVIGVLDKVLSNFDGHYDVSISSGVLVMKGCGNGTWRDCRTFWCLFICWW